MRMNQEDWIVEDLEDNALEKVPDIYKVDNCAEDSHNSRSTKRSKKSKSDILQQRSEASLNISEFNLTEVGKEKIKINELVNSSLKTTGSVVQDNLQRVKKLKNLNVPLSKQQQARIKRSIAKEKICEDVSKWDSLIYSNRTADQIIFPLKKPDYQMKSLEAVAENFVTKHPVEIAVSELLAQSENKLEDDKPLTVAEEKALKAMSAAEAKMRHDELMRHRALISYKEAKARYQNKIKSKKYHRLLKKEKLKKAMKEFEEMKQEDGEKALEKLAELDKLRILERMTLKHRNTGKWAKQQKLRAKYNPESRSILKEDLKLGKQLKGKVDLPETLSLRYVQESLNIDDLGLIEETLSDNGDKNVEELDTTDDPLLEAYEEAFKKTQEENEAEKLKSEKGNLKYFLLEPDACDQYSVMYDGGAKTAVYLNTNPEPSVLQKRESWTETYVEWSPLGTYLATFHPRGVALWVGEKFKQFQRFSHSNVQCVSFSPNEQYLVTFSNIPESREDPHCINIWEIRTGIKKRSFHADSHPMSTWPMFKWSHDDKYFAKIGKDLLSIYETPSFGLLGKKSIKITGIKNFTWSPTHNIVAYWVAEEKDVPARVTLLEIPSRVELRSKNLFSVADCTMHWQKSGGYLCVKVDRYTKAKKEKGEWKYSGMYYNFEIFHMREKNIPVDSAEIKENITAFAWEPVGNKFAVIHGDSPHISVSFYGIKPGGTVSLLKKFERKQCNRIFWSPNGQFVVLAGLRSMSGKLEFVDTSDFTIMSQNEHFMATDIEWDPTGRYVVSGISWWVHKVDNAFWMWSFQGRLLRKNDLERFCQLLWRPRPPTLLSEEKIREIKKTLKKYSAQFDIKDRMTLSKASKEIVDKRRKLIEDFRSIRQKRLDEFYSKKDIRLKLRNGIDTDELDAETENLEEEVVEFLVKEDVTVLEED